MTLASVIGIKHGYAFPGSGIREEPPGDILLTPGNFAVGGGFKGGKFKYFAGEVPADFILDEGDLLVTMTDLSKESDTLGFPALVPKSSVRLLHNQRLGKVEINSPSLIDKRFLFYLLRTEEYRHEVLASATGTTVKHTSPSRILSFRASLPPLPEQKRIAYILGTLDDKIEMNRRMNATLEGISRAIFKSWFVDFDPVRQKAAGKQPVGMDAQTAALFPDSFEDSEIGEVPTGWRSGIIGDCVDVVDCLHTKKPERVDSGRPLLQLNNIRDDGLLDIADTYFISEDDYTKWSAKFETQSGDCVITNVGRVGAVAQIPPGVVAALGRNMTGLRPKATFPFPTFVVECLLSVSMRQEIGRKTDSGTILNALNVKSIPRLRLPIPAHPVTAAFERLARPLRAAMENHLTESHTLAALRDTLLPKLLSGEIRVPEAEEAVQ